MKLLEKLAYSDTNSFSKIFIDYVNQVDILTSFYESPPSYQSIINTAEGINFSKERRKLLEKIIKEQYDKDQISATETVEKVKKENTVFITTGHQLNIFTGPLYVIYKALTVINLSEELNKQQNKILFVPLFWLATEDHDFEEISTFSFFGKSYQWEHPEPKGAVGRLGLDGFNKLLNQLRDLPLSFKEAYTRAKNLQSASRYLLHSLFGKYGMLILDPDNPELKKQFTDVIKKDLSSPIFHKAFIRTSDKLKSKGYKLQANSNRTNLFYLSDKERLRIDNDKKNVFIEEKIFSESKLKNEVDNYPERFSPNVILRPLYQQLILPNAAYIGGPGEIAYWLQLKDLFEEERAIFPVLVPRYSACIITQKQFVYMQKLKVEIKALFKDLSSLKKLVVENLTDSDISLANEKEIFRELEKKLLYRANEKDSSLIKNIKAEFHGFTNRLDHISAKFRKSEEKKFINSINQIEKLKESLFPMDSLQERTTNVLEFLIKSPTFIDDLKENLAGFPKKFSIILTDF